MQKMSRRPSPIRNHGPFAVARQWLRGSRATVTRERCRMSSPLRHNSILLCATLAMVGVAIGCGGDSSSGEPNGPLPAETILVAGNIASCGVSEDDATAALLDTLAGTIFTLGDNAFPNGSAEAYRECFDPAWGRHKTRMYAALGNHEYNTGTATASFDYFGDRVGPRDVGYYSVELGNWHIIVLNISD